MPSISARFIIAGCLAAGLAGLVSFGVIRSRSDGVVGRGPEGEDSGAGEAARSVHTETGRASRHRADNPGSWVPPPSHDSPSAQAAARRGLDLVNAKALVSSLIDVADRQDQHAIEHTKTALARLGSTAKEVLSQTLEKDGLSEPARIALRSAYEQIH